MKVWPKNIFDLIKNEGGNRDIYTGFQKKPYLSRINFFRVTTDLLILFSSISFDYPSCYPISDVT